MKFHRRRFLQLAGVAAAVAVLSVTVTGHGAWSQTARTIKVVVTVQPGGGADFLARVLGEEIGQTQGPTMVIENRPGAGSIIGTEAVSHAAPDGNTLLIINPTFVCICER
jgi:tripartite-type tricarboxylate transporter receptor subunit TctC